MRNPGMALPPGLDLSGLGHMPEQPALGEQRRSAAIQLAIQSGIRFDDAGELIDAAIAIETYLVTGDIEEIIGEVDGETDAGDPPDEPTDAELWHPSDSGE